MTSQLKVLVIEDDIDTQTILGTRLKKRGYTHLAAYDAKEGLRIAQEEDVYAILMDLDLPAIDGYEATKQLKDNPQTKHIPVIAVSANIDYRDKGRLDEVGFESYCLKPIDYHRLFRIMTSFAQRKAAS